MSTWIDVPNADALTLDDLRTLREAGVIANLCFRRPGAQGPQDDGHYVSILCPCGGEATVCPHCDGSGVRFRPPWPDRAQLVLKSI